jgi:hypothetical protein
MKFHDGKQQSNSLVFCSIHEVGKETYWPELVDLLFLLLLAHGKFAFTRCLKIKEMAHEFVRYGSMIHFRTLVFV